MKFSQYVKEFVIGFAVVGLVVLFIAGVKHVATSPHFLIVPLAGTIIAIAFLIRLVGRVVLAEWELHKINKERRG